MISSKEIVAIFSQYLDKRSFISGKKIEGLVKLIVQISKELWNLEDSARMVALGAGHIAAAKQHIDKTNQVRNNTIWEIDLEIQNQMQITNLGSQKLFYAESPGMIIDRLSILCIKRFEIERLLTVIEEEDLQKEYEDKEHIVSKQITNLGSFLDIYFNRLRNKEIFFEVQQPVKIYNDPRIKKYIEFLESQRIKSG